MNEAHVMPVGDLTEHIADDGCHCGPRVEPVQREDGSFGWLHMHHSLDGREASEPPARLSVVPHIFAGQGDPKLIGRHCMVCGMSKNHENHNLAVRERCSICGHREPDQAHYEMFH